MSNDEAHKKLLRELQNFQVNYDDVCEQLDDNIQYLKGHSDPAAYAKKVIQNYFAGLLPAYKAIYLAAQAVNPAEQEALIHIGSLTNDFCNAPDPHRVAYQIKQAAQKAGMDPDVAEDIIYKTSFVFGEEPYGIEALFDRRKFFTAIIEEDGYLPDTLASIALAVAGQKKDTTVFALKQLEPMLQKVYLEQLYALFPNALGFEDIPVPHYSVELKAELEEKFRKLAHIPIENLKAALAEAERRKNDQEESQPNSGSSSRAYGGRPLSTRGLVRLAATRIATGGAKPLVVERWQAQTNDGSIYMSRIPFRGSDFPDIVFTFSNDNMARKAFGLYVKRVKNPQGGINCEIFAVPNPGKTNRDVTEMMQEDYGATAKPIHSRTIGEMQGIYPRDVLLQENVNGFSLYPRDGIDVSLKEALGTMAGSGFLSARPELNAALTGMIEDMNTAPTSTRKQWSKASPEGESFRESFKDVPGVTVRRLTHPHLQPEMPATSQPGIY